MTWGDLTEADRERLVIVKGRWIGHVVSDSGGYFRLLEYGSDDLWGREVPLDAPTQFLIGSDS